MTWSSQLAVTWAPGSIRARASEPGWSQPQGAELLLDTPREDTELVRLTGQLLVVGFSGTELPSQVEQALAEQRLAGVILFRRNLPDLDSLSRLTSAVTRLGDPPPLVSIDEEGGRVTRLPEGLPRLPSMRALGQTRDETLCFQAGEALGELLRVVGVTLDFAPVLDVDTNPQNPVIGDRSFGPDPKLVARLGVALARGLLSGGVLPCGKHFPGHGDTMADSHLDLPQVVHGRDRLEQVELYPFRAAIEQKIGALMTAHVVYDALDPGVPATLSPRILRDLLRARLGFDGAVFSDDLTMRALSDRLPLEQSAVRAVRAGCDLLVVSRDWARAQAGLMAECRADSGFVRIVEQAARRSLKLRLRARDLGCSAGEVWVKARRLASVVSRIEECPGAQRTSG